MGDLCLDDEITDNPLSSNQIGHVVNDYSRVEENSYQGRHVVHVDAVTNTGFLIDSFGLHSSLGDIFSHLWTLTVYRSHQFVDFIEDLVFHDIEEYSNNLAPGSSRPFSRSSDHGVCKSYFEGYSSSSNSSPGFCGRKPQDKRKELSVNKYKTCCEK